MNNMNDLFTLEPPIGINCRICDHDQNMICLATDKNGYNFYHVFWCPLCGSILKLFDEPISISDFTASYVVYEKGMCCRSPIPWIRK